MILGLHHASITIAQLDRLSAFYRDQLGFETVLETSWEAGNTTADTIFGLTGTAVRMVMLRTSNAFLELFEFAAPLDQPSDPQRPVCDQGITHICLAVSDIAAARPAGSRRDAIPQPAAGRSRIIPRRLWPRS